MAPEQWKSAKTVSSASDQWALAIIVYKLVTGISPFRAENAQGIMFRVASESIAPFGPELSAFGGFEKALAKALEKDPANRYRSVRAFTAALLPFASQGTQQRWMNEFIGDLATDPAPIMTQMLSDLPPPLASSVKPPASSQPPASKARPALSDSLAASEQQIDVRPLSRFSVRYGLLGAAITIAAVVGVATKVFVHRSSSQLQTYDAGLPSHLTAASPTTNPTAIIATGETADGAGLSYDAAVTLHQDAGVHHSHLGHHDGASAEHQGTSTVNPGTPAPPGRTPIGTGLPESPNI